MASHAAHDRLAALLEYPRPGFAALVSDALRAMQSACPEAAAHLVPLADHALSASLAESEEQFIATFELSPVCAPEIGWQLYGDQYARGMFLVRMRELMRSCGLPETSELPDHLGHVIRVAARCDAAKARKLTTSFALPALEKMLGHFEGKGNPYEGVLRAAQVLLSQRSEEAAAAAAAEVSRGE